MSAVNHPDHYGRVPNIECIDVIEWFPCNPANAMKYIWRAGLKDPDAIFTDYRKAIWYLEREIARLSKGKAQDCDTLAETGEENIMDSNMNCTCTYNHELVCKR